MRKLMVMTIASFLLLFLGFSGQSMARVDISVSIPPPPIFTFSAPPELVVIPGTYVYFDPYLDFDIFFYAGYWYRPHRGYWYRSVAYEGPWVYIGSPPPVLLRLPPDFRIMTRGYPPISYWELRNNWRTWQTNRYWDRHDWNRYWRERPHAWGPSYRERHGGRYDQYRERGAAPYFRDRDRRDRDDWGSRERHDWRTEQQRERTAPSRERHDWRMGQQEERTAPSRERRDWRMEQQRERGLSPSYRGERQPGHGSGTIRQRSEMRSDAARENRSERGKPQGGARQEREGRH